jgi:hypothetical protein
MGKRFGCLVEAVDPIVDRMDRVVAQSTPFGARIPIAPAFVLRSAASPVTSASCSWRRRTLPLSLTATLSPASRALRQKASNSWRIRSFYTLPNQRGARARDCKHLWLKGVVGPPSLMVGYPAMIRIGQMDQRVTQSLHQPMEVTLKRKERPHKPVGLAEPSD